MTPERSPLRIVIIVAAALAAAAGGLLIGLVLGRSGSPHGDHAPAVTPDGRVQEYTCSMHPDFRSTNPNDRCPRCGMALIPVPADEDGDEDASLPRLRVSPRSAALMQIQTRPAHLGDADVLVRVFGRVEYDERRLRTVAARFPGRLDRLHVNVTGERVERGAALADIYSPELITAQEELLQAVAAAREGTPLGAEAAAVSLQAARDRLRLWGLEAGQISDVEQGGRVLEHMTIRAPLAGTVIERMATEGSYVQTGQPLYQLADLQAVWVNLEVYESQLPWVYLWQDAEFTTESYPGEVFRGSVAFIDPVVDDATRTVRLRVELPNEDGRLKPAMFVRGRLHASAALLQAHGDGHEDHAGDSKVGGLGLPLLIPASAPLITGQRAVVYVQDAAADRPTFEARQVVLGPRAGDYYVVREGLQPGELVVVNGAFKIDSELQIRGRPSMMAPEGGAPVAAHHGHAAAGDAAAGHAAPPSDAQGAQPAAPVETRPEIHAAIAATLRANFKLVAALADDDVAGSRQAAQQARAALGPPAGDDWPADVARAWNLHRRTMDQALARVADSEDLPALRANFEPFSDELTRVVRAYGVGGVPAVFRAMCPMVQGRRGYWLQDNRLIANPYHGSGMLRCGEIVEDLSPAAAPAPAPAPQPPPAPAPAPPPPPPAGHEHH